VGSEQGSYGEFRATTTDPVFEQINTLYRTLALRDNVIGGGVRTPPSLRGIL